MALILKLLFSDGLGSMWPALWCLLLSYMEGNKPETCLNHAWEIFITTPPLPPNQKEHKCCSCVTYIHLHISPGGSSSDKWGEGCWISKLSYHQYPTWQQCETSALCLWPLVEVLRTADCRQAHACIHETDGWCLACEVITYLWLWCYLILTRDVIWCNKIQHQGFSKKRNI